MAIDMADTLVTTLNKKTDTQARERLVCFVCTGNTCRSPMAAAVFNHLIGSTEVSGVGDFERLISDRGLRATSAGLCAHGEPISKNACEALFRAGISSREGNDYKAHVSRPIDEEIMRSAELVVGISSSHAMSLMMQYPQFASKITCMPQDISDPYGGSAEVYRECLAQIQRGVEEIYKRL